MFGWSEQGRGGAVRGCRWPAPGTTVGARGGLVARDATFAANNCFNH